MKYSNKNSVEGASGHSDGIPFSGSHPTSASYRVTRVSERRWMFNINYGLSDQEALLHRNSTEQNHECGRHPKVGQL